MSNQIQSLSGNAAIPEMGSRPVARAGAPEVRQEKEQPSPQEVSREALEVATNRVRSFVETRTSELQFSVDESSGSRVVRVFDKGTKELIRQIPSQEVLDMAIALERLQGLLLKQKA